jgi:hypothetical protein
MTHGLLFFKSELIDLAIAKNDVCYKQQTTKQGNMDHSLMQKISTKGMKKRVNFRGKTELICCSSNR